MKAKLKLNETDSDMVELWNEDGNTLYSVFHIDLLWKQEIEEATAIDKALKLALEVEIEIKLCEDS